MNQALKRLRVLAVLDKQDITQTVLNMMEGLASLGAVRATSNLDFNIGYTEARQSFMVSSTTRAVSNFFLSKGFRHTSAGQMRKSIGDSIATVNFTLAGGYGVAVTLKVYSGRS